MGRTAGDAALDFEMNMLLDTKEAEASAARLEKGLGGVLSIFESIGKAAVGTVGIIGSVLKAPADLDNYLGSLNTKITNVRGELLKYRDVLLQVQGANKAPGSSLFGFSSTDHQKAMMGFARGAAEAEKYSKSMASNYQGYATGVGALSKGIGIPIEETTGIITSFHRELGISYTGMEKFSKALTNMSRQSGMTATQTKTLFRTVTSLGRAYGLTGKNAEKFVLDSVAVGAAISKIGLDATEVLTKMNEVATGSEQGLIQSLLLGFKPSDPEGQLKAFNAQAKMITQMAGQAGEQFAPYLTRQLGNKLGLKNFSVEQIQALSRGEMIESDEKRGETVQLDMLEVLKGIKDSQLNSARMNEGTYATFGQHMQEGFTKLITFLQHTFTPAMNQLKNIMANLIPRIIPIMQGIWDVLKSVASKIMDFFKMGKSPLGTLGVGAALLSLIPFLPTIVGAVVKIIGSMASGLMSAGGSLIDSAGKGAAQGAAAGTTGAAVGGLSKLWSSKAAIEAATLGMQGPTGLAAASTLAIAGTLLSGLLVGGAIGMIIDHFWKGESKTIFFDSMYEFFAGKAKDNREEANRAISNARGAQTLPAGQRPAGESMGVEASIPNRQKILAESGLGIDTPEGRRAYAMKDRERWIRANGSVNLPPERARLNSKYTDIMTARELEELSTNPNYKLREPATNIAARTDPTSTFVGDSSHTAAALALAKGAKEKPAVAEPWYAEIVKALGGGGSFPSFGGSDVADSPLMTNIDATASKFNLRRTDKPGQVHVGDHKFARDFSLRKSEGSAEFLDDDTVKKIVASFDPNLYWANDEKTANPKLPKEERDKHVRHLHVQLKEQYRGMAEGGFGGGALDNLSGTGGMLVRDAESHDLLREIANKLGISVLSANANTSQGTGTPMADKDIAALTPLHLNTSIWNDVQIRRNQLVSLPGGGLLGAS